MSESDRPQPPGAAAWLLSPRVLLAFSVVGLVGGAALLHQLNPATSLLPRCVFHVVTSLHCPGCGSTRALHALLHGDVAAAVRFNPLTLPALAALGYAYARWSWGVLTRRPGEHFGARVRGSVLFALAIGIAVFWIARNVPVYPLTLLAPPAAL